MESGSDVGSGLGSVGGIGGKGNDGGCDEADVCVVAAFLVLGATIPRRTAATTVATRLGSTVSVNSTENSTTPSELTWIRI